MWKVHLKDVQDSLNTVSHLFKEEHVVDTEPSIGVSSGNVTDDDQDTNGNSFAEPNVKMSKLIGNWLSDGEEFVMMKSQQSESPSSEHHKSKYFRATSDNDVAEKKVFSFCKSANSPISNNSSANTEDVAEMMNLSLGESNSSGEHPSWFSEALKGDSNISELTGIDNEMGYNKDLPQIFGSPSNQHFPAPRFLEQPHREDPTIFHLNAFDSPPPSPGHEMEDYVYNMRQDPNGMIPDIANMHDQVFEIQENNNTQNAHVCHLELCKSFHHLLRTTPENVEDKKSIMKEILHHAECLMNVVIENCPLEMKEDMIEILASIFLINNSLQRSSTVESFLNASEVTQCLVHKVKTGIDKYL